MQSSRWTIVIVNDYSYVNGGAGQIALSSARELARRGHSVILFSAVGPPDPSLAEAGVHIVCTDQPDILNNPNRIGAAVQGIWNSRSAKSMEALLGTLDPRKTLVHIHGWSKAISSSVAPAVLAHGASLVVTVHDYFLVCPNGGLFNYVSNTICHLSPL